VGIGSLDKKGWHAEKREGIPIKNLAYTVLLISLLTRDQPCLLGITPSEIWTV
jgi:hypothetical protein